MRRPSLTLGLVPFAVLAAACSSSPSSAPSTGSVHQLAASLDPSQVVDPTTGSTVAVPSSLSGAAGTFTGTVDSASRRLAWHLSFQGLGTPSVVIADVHYGATGSFGRLLVRLCGPCRSSRPSGTVSVPATGTSALVSGGAWVTVNTATYPNGAIRGQITSH